MTASFTPSLKHSTLAQIAAQICNDTEVRRLINQLDFMYDKVGNEYKWKELLNTADLKVSELHLPPLLHQSVVGVIKPIALEIARWKSDHYKLLGTEFNFNNCHLYWHSEGIIDRRTTAEKLFYNENLCIVNRFFLACYYCYEKEVDRIWNIMSLAEKSQIYDENFTNSVSFWLPWIENKDNINWSELVSLVVFQLYPNTICNYLKNRVWLRYFFDRITLEEKKQCIMYTVENTVKDHDNFRFCVSRLDENERELFFRKYPFRLLRFFLDWPYQSLFSEATEQMWKYLTEKDFRYLLHFIIYSRIAAEWYDFDYVDLLKDFWHRSPKQFKEYIKKDSIYQPVKMIIDHRFPQLFPKKEIVQSFSYTDKPIDKYLLLREGDFFNSF